MKLTGKMFIGFLLIFIGANIFFSMVGIHFGGIVKLAIGAALLYWGYSRYQDNGSWSLSSVILIVIGIGVLFGGLGGIISLLIGAFFVYVGYQFITQRQKDKEVIEDDVELPRKSYDSLDEEIDRLLEKK